MRFNQCECIAFAMMRVRHMAFWTKRNLLSPYIIWGIICGVFSIWFYQMYFRVNDSFFNFEIWWILIIKRVLQSLIDHVKNFAVCFHFFVQRIEKIILFIQNKNNVWWNLISYKFNFYFEKKCWNFQLLTFFLRLWNKTLFKIVFSKWKNYIIYASIYYFQVPQYK